MRRSRPARRGGARWLAAVALLLLGAPPAAAAGAPLCLARLELEPSEAFVGQQVLYRLRLLSRDDVRAMEWHEPPAFPRLRAERLPGRPDAGRIVREGVSYRVREEHRALFPERAGEIPLAPASLHCRAAHEVLDLRVPEATLRARDLPAEGRPADFAGLIGPVALARSVEPRVVALGASLRVVVRLQGDGNLWDARDPLPDDAAFGGAEVFRRRPELDLERGTSLFVRRRFVYDLVPRREGRLVVPEIRVAYFDPAARRYQEARAPAVEVTVEARAPSARAAAELLARVERARFDPEAPEPDPTAVKHAIEALR